MKLNYIQKIIFSFLEVISGSLNLVTSILGKSPTWDLSGSYLKKKMDVVYFNQVNNTAKDRKAAHNEYKERVNGLTPR